MTSKKDSEIDLGSFDDDFNFDDFNFDDEMPDGDSRKPSSKVKKGLTSFFSGFSGNLGSNLKNRIKKELPDSTNRVEEIKSFVDDLKYLGENISSESTKSIISLKRSGRLVAPKLKNFIGDKYTEKLKKALETEEDSPRLSEEQQKQQNEESAVTSTLETIFKVDAEDREQRYKQEQQDRLIDATIASKRHKDLFDEIRGVRTSLVRLDDFSNKVTLSYYKKDLELGMKQLFVGRDILTATRNQAKMLETKLDQVRHNTSLPEIQKITASELWKEQSLNKITSSMSSSVGKLFTKPMDKLKGMAKDAISQLESMSGMVEMAAGFSEYDTEERTWFDMLANLAGKGAGKIASGRINKYLFGQDTSDSMLPDFLKKIVYGEDKKGGTASALAKRLEARAKHAKFNTANRIQDGSNDYNSFWKSLFSFMSPQIDRTAGSIRSSVGNPLEPTSFDKGTRLTINEIIPGLLSKILQQTTILATGNPNVEELVYDTSKRDFTTAKSYARSTLQKAFGTAQDRTRKMDEAFAVLSTGAKLGNSKIDESFEYDLKTVITNISLTKQSIRPEIIEKFISDESSLDNSERMYLGEIFSGVEDRKAVAEVLLKSLSGGSSADRDFIVSEFSTKTQNMMDNQQYLSTLSREVDFGQGRHLKGLLNKSYGGYEVNSDAYRKITMQNEKLDNNYHITSIEEDLIKQSDEYKELVKTYGEDTTSKALNGLLEKIDKFTNKGISTDIFDKAKSNFNDSNFNKQYKKKEEERKKEEDKKKKFLESQIDRSGSIDDLLYGENIDSDLKETVNKHKNTSVKDLNKPEKKGFLKSLFDSDKKSDTRGLSNIVNNYITNNYSSDDKNKSDINIDLTTDLTSVEILLNSIKEVSSVTSVNTGTIIELISSIGMKGINVNDDTSSSSSNQSDSMLYIPNILKGVSKKISKLLGLTYDATKAGGKFSLKTLSNLKGPLGSLFSSSLSVGKTILDKGTSATKFTFNKATEGLQKLSNKIKGRLEDGVFVDLYLKGKYELGKPLVTAKRLRECVFADGTPIISIYKIDKPVIDPITKETVISQEDIDNGFLLPDGKPLLNMVFGLAKRGYEKLKDLGTAGWGLLKDGYNWATKEGSPIREMGGSFKDTIVNLFSGIGNKFKNAGSMFSSSVGKPVLGRLDKLLLALKYGFKLSEDQVKEIDNIDVGIALDEEGKPIESNNINTAMQDKFKETIIDPLKGKIKEEYIDPLTGKIREDLIDPITGKLKDKADELAKKTKDKLSPYTNKVTDKVGSGYNKVKNWVSGMTTKGDDDGDGVYSASERLEDRKNRRTTRTDLINKKRAAKREKIENKQEDSNYDNLKKIEKNTRKAAENSGEGNSILGTMFGGLFGLLGGGWVLNKIKNMLPKSLTKLFGKNKLLNNTPDPKAPKPDVDNKTKPKTDTDTKTKADTETKSKSKNSKNVKQRTAKNKFNGPKSLVDDVAKGGAKTAVKTGSKGLMKSLGKGIIKRMPQINATLAAMYAYDRYSEGDYTGSALEVASGLLGFLSVPGMIASNAIDLYLYDRDWKKENTQDMTVNPVSKLDPNLAKEYEKIITTDISGPHILPRKWTVEVLAKYLESIPEYANVKVKDTSGKIIETNHTSGTLIDGTHKYSQLALNMLIPIYLEKPYKNHAFEYMLIKHNRSGIQDIDNPIPFDWYVKNISSKDKLPRVDKISDIREYLKSLISETKVTVLPFIKNALSANKSILEDFKSAHKYTENKNKNIKKKSNNSLSSNLAKTNLLSKLGSSGSNISPIDSVMKTLSDRGITLGTDMVTNSSNIGNITSMFENNPNPASAGEFDNKVVDGEVCLPTDSNYITSPYGPRNVQGGSPYHRGIDLRARMGEPIYAIADGTVTFVGGDYGTIEIHHEKIKKRARYLHLSAFKVKKGDKVKVGQVIGLSGKTGPKGSKYAAHLHFDIREDKYTYWSKTGPMLDPEKMFKSLNLKTTRDEKQENRGAPLSDVDVETKDGQKYDPPTEDGKKAKVEKTDDISKEGKDVSNGTNPTSSAASEVPTSGPGSLTTTLTSSETSTTSTSDSTSTSTTPSTSTTSSSSNYSSSDTSTQNQSSQPITDSNSAIVELLSSILKSLNPLNELTNINNSINTSNSLLGDTVKNIGNIAKNAGASVSNSNTSTNTTSSSRNIKVGDPKVNVSRNKYQ